MMRIYLIGEGWLSDEEYKKRYPDKPLNPTKIFISQPMSGRTEDEIVEERATIIELISKKYPWLLPLQIIDSFHSEALNEGNPVRELGKCISLMYDADYVVFANNWNKSRGCKIEHDVAVEYGLRRIYQFEDLVF